MKVRFENIP